MNFEELKKKALELKDKVVVEWKKAIEAWAESMAKSSLTLKTNEEISSFVDKSAQKTFTDQKTAEVSIFDKKTIIIFAESNTDFFKELMYILPILSAKSFTASVPIKIVDTKVEWLNLQNFNLTVSPTMIVFQNLTELKRIESKENIIKLVKSVNLDINKSIEAL